MTNKYLKDYKLKLGNLSINEQKLRDLHLRKLALGELQGPPVGYASIDKPWLGLLPEFDYDYEYSKKSIYKMIADINKDMPDSLLLHQDLHHHLFRK